MGGRASGNVTLEINAIEPPLAFADATFDLVYAISVFTHLPETLQWPWIVELHRVIEPGGVLLLTLSGEGDFERITESEREQFRRGELVVVDADYAGTNMCGVYHPLRTRKPIGATCSESGGSTLRAH